MNTTHITCERLFLFLRKIQCCRIIYGYYKWRHADCSKMQRVECGIYISIVVVRAM